MTSLRAHVVCTHATLPHNAWVIAGAASMVGARDQTIALFMLIQLKRSNLKSMVSSKTFSI